MENKNQEKFFSPSLANTQKKKTTLKCEKSRNASGLFDIINIFFLCNANLRLRRTPLTPLLVADRHSSNLMKHFYFGREKNIHQKEIRKQLFFSSAVVVRVRAIKAEKIFKSFDSATNISQTNSISTLFFFFFCVIIAEAQKRNEDEFRYRNDESTIFLFVSLLIAGGTDNGGKETLRLLISCRL